MDVAHAVVAVLENVDHRVEQRLDAAVVARLDRNHRHAQHAAQAVVVELRSAPLQLVVHVERHDHPRIDVDQFGGQVEVAFQIRRHDRVDHHVGRLLGDMAADIPFLGRVGRQGIGSGQVRHLETVTAVVAVADLGADGHAAVVAHVLVAARDGVEQRRLAAVGIAHQRHGDRAAAARHHLVHRRARISAAARAVAGRRTLSAFPDATGGFAAAALRSQILAGLGVGEHDDHVGFAAPQRNVVPHDFVFDRVLQGRVQDHLDALAADEPHLHDATAESSVSRHFDDRRRFAGFQFG